MLMGNKGNSRHLKSLAAPKYYGLHRKERFYSAKASPGRHSGDRSLPLIIALRDLSLAGTKNEGARIIRDGTVTVNRRVVRDIKYPIGLNDTIEFGSIGKAYRVGVESHGRATFSEVKKGGHDAQVFKVVGKFKVRKGVLRIRLHDGSVLEAAKPVRVNDSVTLGADGKLKGVLPLEVGAKCTVIDGVHTGTEGKIKGLRKGSINAEASATVEDSKGASFDTIIKNIMVTG